MYTFMHRGHFSSRFVHNKKQKQILVKVYIRKIFFFALVIFYGLEMFFLPISIFMFKHVFAFPN